MKKLIKGLFLTTVVTGAAIATAYHLAKGSKQQEEPIYIEDEKEESKDKPEQIEIEDGDNHNCSNGC